MSNLQIGIIVATLIGWWVNLSFIFLIKLTHPAPSTHSFSKTEIIILCVPYGPLIRDFLFFITRPWRK